MILVALARLQAGQTPRLVRVLFLALILSRPPANTICDTTCENSGTLPFRVVNLEHAAALVVTVDVVIADHCLAGDVVRCMATVGADPQPGFPIDRDPWALHVLLAVLGVGREFV